MTNVVIYQIHTWASIETRLRPAIIYILRAGPSCRIKREIHKLDLMSREYSLKYVLTNTFGCHWRHLSIIENCEYVNNNSNHNNLQSSCSAKFCLFSQQRAAPGLLKTGFYFTRLLITSNSPGSKFDWMIMCSARCSLYVCESKIWNWFKILLTNLKLH